MPSKSLSLVVLLTIVCFGFPSQSFSAVEAETTSTSATVTEEQVSQLPVADPLDKLINTTVGNYLDTLTLDSVVNTYFVKGDRGRFRQDWWTDDRTTGGFRDIAFNGSQNGISYEYDGRAIIDYDYWSRLLVKRPDDFYFDLEGKWFRKYWDGSQDDPWDPTAYRLGDEFQDWSEDNLHTDRGNINAEFGKSLSEDAKVILKYELWTRQGRMPTLRGEQATRTGLANLRSIAMRTRVDGVSNKFTAAAPFRVSQIHNFEPSISFELYKDSQFTDSARYANGALNQKRDYIDKPSFADLRGQFKYDSFLTDNVYVHGGYAVNLLKNDSVRSEVRPTAANPNISVNPDTDNWRLSNAVSLGTALLNFLRQKNLDVRLGFRGEHAITNGHTTYFNNLLNRRELESRLNEGWFGEAASVTYRGIPRTTAYAGVDLEQRRLRWQEEFDARSHEGVTDFGRTDIFPRYKTDITYIDFVPRIKLTHRLNSHVRATADYKWKHKDRQYDTIIDSDPVYYPGVLGDMERRVHEITGSVNVRLPEAWASTLKYQMVKDDIDFNKVGNNQQDADRHRISGTLSGPIAERLFAYLTGAYEYYRLNTPTESPGGNLWSNSEDSFDFIGDYFLIACNFNYHLTKAISTFLSYQATVSIGDNRNALNKFLAGFKYNINETTTLEARYQLFHFNDNRAVDGGWDDDYRGQGMAFGLKKALG